MLTRNVAILMTCAILYKVFLMIRIYGSFSAKDDKQSLKHTMEFQLTYFEMKLQHCHYIFTNDGALLKQYPVCQTELW